MALTISTSWERKISSFHREITSSLQVSLPEGTIGQWASLMTGDRAMEHHSKYKVMRWKLMFKQCTRIIPVHDFSMSRSSWLLHVPKLIFQNFWPFLYLVSWLPMASLCTSQQRPFCKFWIYLFLTFKCNLPDPSPSCEFLMASSN